MPTAAIIAVDCELQAGHGAVPHPRRLASHDDVPTELFAVDSDVQADWDHDYVILKLVLAKVGYDVNASRHLCELPPVYCDYGYRRRVPQYAKTLMGDWVGREYILNAGIPNSSLPVHFDPSIFDLKRVGFLSF